MANPEIYTRLVEPRINEALADTPVVLIHGPRQCGKTTLARMVGEKRDYAYFSFDDDVALAAAQADPVGFVGDLPERTILDEVQQAPELFTALKTAVDRDRTPGRFLLTGSANVLLVPKLADSLAGRIEILRLHPLAQAELAEEPSAFLDRLFGAGFKIGTWQRLREELPKRIVAGGYPAALARGALRRRAVWYRDYIETLVQRDVRDLARIRLLDALPRLLMLAAGQTARLLNVTDLAAPFQLSRPTIRDYVMLLTRVFLLDELPSWHSNRLRRLVKTPKLHLGDTGLACALLGVDAAALQVDRELLGQLLETFVFQELRRQASWQEDVVTFYHFRDKDGVEVDIVLETGSQRVAGVEVKAAATVTASDFRGLRKLRQAAGKRFSGGVVLYDGETMVSFGDGLYAVPIRCLWEKSVISH
ncbi:MAG: ATP-binding protein [Candidatus Thiodiazotropha sp. (ex Dulcina madagascariensis)]|nr:ATP-binding protein [Candidatus Thiodiazotropha sp. (ex Dulcina madagascariensis)]MCU7928239.1 ATP-binding protein [Candidatus Thiodiazotropha sp. (ex Dulcina madagascariensis)]